jgi:hypothetical protein
VERKGGGTVRNTDRVQLRGPAHLFLLGRRSCISPPCGFSVKCGVRRNRPATPHFLSFSHGPYSFPPLLTLLSPTLIYPPHTRIISRLIGQALLHMPSVQTFYGLQCSPYRVSLRCAPKLFSQCRSLHVIAAISERSNAMATIHVHAVLITALRVPSSDGDGRAGLAIFDKGLC